MDALLFIMISNILESFDSDIYNLISMGNAPKSPQQEIFGQVPSEPREMTAQQRWQSSQKSQQDLIELISILPTLAQGRHIVFQFLRSIGKREKYQNYLLCLLDYLQSSSALQRHPHKQRKEMFFSVNRRMQASYFVTQQFPDLHLDLGMRAVDRLYFLYEYYVSAEEQMQRAIFFNYPSIFIEFSEFVRVLLEDEVLINESHLCTYVLQAHRLQEMKEYFEVVASSCDQGERQRLLGDAERVQDLKEVYLGGVEQLLRFDYADAASALLRCIKKKGYSLNEKEEEYWLKAEMHCLFLYQLGKLSLSFVSLQQQTLNQILHYFFSNFDLTQTPLLRNCFSLFENSEREWTERVSNYLFSSMAHISTLIRVMEHGYVKLVDFRQLLDKIRLSRCDIGKYSKQLSNFVQMFNVDASVKDNYVRLLKLVQIYHLFNIHAQVQFLYPIVFTDWNHLSQNDRGQMSARGVQLLTQIIQGYFGSFEVKMRSIECQGRSFSFSNIFEVVRFVQFIIHSFLHDFISHSVAHQIFFKQLIKHEHYIDIKALMGEERVEEFGMDGETVHMMVTDHLIAIMSERKIRKTQESIKLLMSILGLSVAGNSWHYVLSYYHYLKYLEERDVVLPLPMKETISTGNLYFIATHYPLKLDQLDFNFLFGHQSCIKLHYCDSPPFIPIITDDFLKFKVFLCSKAFAGKKHKYAGEVLQEVIRYQPPWLATELVRILKENPTIDDSFVALAFNFCARGEDLEFILSLAAARSKQSISSDSKLSLLNDKFKNWSLLNDKLKNWTSFLEEDRYLMLTEQLVVGEQYMNLVAELTFNQGGEIKQEHSLFFHLLTVQPERAFNYAINHNMSPVFIFNFILQGVKRGVIHLNNAQGFLLKFLYFSCKKQSSKAYITFKEYVSTKVQAISDEKMVGGSYSVAAFERMCKNWHVQRAVTRQFLELYVSNKDQSKFLYDEPFRREVVVGLREQPMSKLNSKVLKALCERTGVDILELVLYHLTSRANTQDFLDDQSWTLAQKLIHWGDDPKVASSVLKRLVIKVQSLNLLLALLDFLRESEPAYQSFVSQWHLQIVRSLAALEVEKDLFGIIPQDFFHHSIAVRVQTHRAKLSNTHRRILQRAATVQNIFVLSKVLYFMYGCSEQVQKVVLGEFSIRQQDSQHFQELRKKIKEQSQG